MRSILAVAAAGLLTASVANAGVTSTITVANDYDFRGISLSAENPAIQASLDYTHESGFYVGAWASTADFGPGYDVNFELDLYAGFSKTAESGLGYSAGIVYYQWPSGQYPSGGGLSYGEIFAGLSYKMFSTKLWYSNDYSSLSEDGFYWEGNVAVPLPHNFTLNGHVGYSWGDYWSDINGDEPLDWSVGVGYVAGKFNFAVKYVKTESDVIIRDDAFNNEGRVIATIATTFPWGD